MASHTRLKISYYVREQLCPVKVIPLSQRKNWKNGQRICSEMQRDQFLCFNLL